MQTANPNDTVRFSGHLWRIETRVGGVYQLRAFRADGLGLTDDLRLAQRHQFVVTSRANGGSDHAEPAPLRTPLVKAFPKAPAYLTRKATRVGNPQPFVPNDAEAFETGGPDASFAGMQLRAALAAGIDIDAAD